MVANRLYGAELEKQRVMLMSRSGELCEVRSPECLAKPDGWLGRLTLAEVNAHHRVLGGMGGSADPHRNDLSRLVLTCGRGNASGCHGYVHRNVAWSEQHGFIVPRARPGHLTDATDCTIVPLTLHSGRRVRLGDFGEYLPPMDGLPYAA